MAMLDKVKIALRITTDAYDGELTDMIAEAEADLGILGVTNATETDDPLIRRAIILFCRIHHGSPDDFERLSASYDALKGRLRMATGYTDWDEDADGDADEAEDGDGE